jgi:hypothetical protein
MKYIRFADEVLRVPESVTFWIMCRGDEYSAPYCVNMSPLTPQTFCGEPSLEGLIRSEGYKTQVEAIERLTQLLELLNK